MAYKQKTCPTCSTVHTKRGPYCSRSCGNRREWTTEQKEVFREKKTDWLNSDDDRAEVERWNIRKSEETEPVAPMQYSKLDTNQFISDGDLWTED